MKPRIARSPVVTLAHSLSLANSGDLNCFQDVALERGRPSIIARMLDRLDGNERDSAMKMNV